MRYPWMIACAFLLPTFPVQASTPDTNGILSQAMKNHTPRTPQIIVQERVPALSSKVSGATAREAGLEGWVVPTALEQSTVRVRLNEDAGRARTVDLYGDRLMEIAIDGAAQHRPGRPKSRWTTMAAADGGDLVAWLVPVRREFKRPNDYMRKNLSRGAQNFRGAKPAFVANATKMPYIVRPPHRSVSGIVGRNIIPHTEYNLFSDSSRKKYPSSLQEKNGATRSLQYWQNAWNRMSTVPEQPRVTLGVSLPGRREEENQLVG